MMEPLDEFDHNFRVLLLGNSGVGKSSMLNKYVEGITYDDINATIGVDFKCKKIVHNDLKIKLQIWDTAGQERFRSIVQTYYRSAQCVLILYDVSSQESFVDAKYWLEQTKSYIKITNIPIMLVANKIDRTDRVITKETGEQFAKDNNIYYSETSVSDQYMTDKIFDKLVNKMLELHMFSTRNKKEGIKLGENKSVNIKPCGCSN